MASPRPLHPVPERKDRDWLLLRLTAMLGGDQDALRDARRIRALVDEHVAWMVERYARPPSRHWGPGGGWTA